MVIVEVRRLVKTFGQRHAVREISFSASKGECLGLLGRNGAGKTTLLRIIAGLLPPGSGEVRLFGVPARRVKELHDRIGVMHQHTSLPDFLSVDEYLRLEADLRGLGPETVERAIELSEAERLRHIRIGRLSEGTKRKLLLFRTLMHEPRLLLLDEPTTGLDLLTRREVWKTLMALRDSGMVILLATHDLLEAESICTRLLVLSDGELVMDVNTDQLWKKGANLASAVSDLLAGVAPSLREWRGAHEFD